MGRYLDPLWRQPLSFASYSPAIQFAYSLQWIISGWATLAVQTAHFLAQIFTTSLHGHYWPMDAPDSANRPKFRTFCVILESKLNGWIITRSNDTTHTTPTLPLFETCISFPLSGAPLGTRDWIVWAHWKQRCPVSTCLNPLLVISSASPALASMAYYVRHWLCNA